MFLMDWVSTRKERALYQRMFLMNAFYNDKDLWKFTVKGHSGTNYHISLTPMGMKCSCPDYTRRQKLCKHLYFIIGRIAQDMTILDALDDKCIFINVFRINPKLSNLLKTKLRNRMEDIGENINPDRDTNCSICFERMKKCPRCSYCQNMFHKECINLWLAKNRNCPLCRKSWKEDSKDEMRLFVKFVEKT